MGLFLVGYTNQKMLLNLLLEMKFHSLSNLDPYLFNPFADEDEEGDRITVRGDEELQAMISGVGINM